MTGPFELICEDHPPTPEVDLGSSPWEALSNFAPHGFIFRGVYCASMEGLLQSLKFSDPERQRAVCLLIGRKAKFKGKKKKWYLDHCLYWQGEALCRFGDTYLSLVHEAFTARAEQNPAMLEMLLLTGDAPLTHHIGKADPRETILTEAEFVAVMARLRARARCISPV